MRKRERDEVAAVARRRLEALSVELAGLRAERDRDGERCGPVAPAPSGDPFVPPPAGVGRPAVADVPAFFEQPVPVHAGPPGDLPGQVPAWVSSGDLSPDGGAVQAPVGRPLPPEPVRAPVPGRHAVPRAGEGVAGRVEDWMDDRLPDSVRRRVALSGQHLLVLVGALGVALALAGWFTMRGGTGEEVAPRAELVSQRSGQGSGRPPGQTAAGASASAAPGAASSPSGTVVVDVAGKVRRPGIVTLPAGSRVHDAIERAGGVQRGARTTTLNLARVLTDGEQVLVGVPQPAGAVGAGAAASGGSAGSGGAGGPSGGALVSLNTAGLSELDTLPGVGPVTAQKILDWRAEHGAFSAVDELLEVDGIGDKTLADIKPRVTL